MFSHLYNVQTVHKLNTVVLLLKQHLPLYWHSKYFSAVEMDD